MTIEKDFDTEFALALEYWAWLDEQRKLGKTPTTEERKAHPALVKLREMNGLCPGCAANGGTGTTSDWKQCQLCIGRKHPARVDCLGRPR